MQRVIQALLNGGIQVSPIDRTVVERMLVVSRLRHLRAAEDEILRALEEVWELTLEIHPMHAGREREERRGPGRPRDDVRWEWIYHDARHLWNYYFGLPWPIHNRHINAMDFSDLTGSPIAEFFVAYAQSVDPAMTQAKCHTVAERLRKALIADLANLHGRSA